MEFFSRCRVIGEKMNIENIRYVRNTITNEVDAIIATINGVQCNVPLSPGNRHYDEIMRQVEAGTLTIADAE